MKPDHFRKTLTFICTMTKLLLFEEVGSGIKGKWIKRGSFITMACAVFILGRTGSGKSTTARFLADFAQHEGWSVQAFNDYPFLRQMYEKDTSQKFRPTVHDGFEVLDLSVYETAIGLLAKKVQGYRPANDRTLITIEFTSNNYRDAFQLFDASLLQDARFLFLAVDLKTCLERTGKRVLNAITEDDYHVIDTVLLRHYPSPYMPVCFSKERTRLIQNMGSLNELRYTINKTVLPLFEFDGQHQLAHS